MPSTRYVRQWRYSSFQPAYMVGLVRRVARLLLPTQSTEPRADGQVYKELMPDPKPARTCVGVAQLPAGGTDVEIEFVAYDG
jgi:enamine deaminase RidA (YjgF/YER057c/UK114 family)